MFASIQKFPVEKLIHTHLFFMRPKVSGHSMRNDKVCEGIHKQNEPQSTKHIEQVDADVILKELGERRTESICNSAIMDTVEVSQIECTCPLCILRIHFTQRIDDAAAKTVLPPVNSVGINSCVQRQCRFNNAF